MKIKNLWNHHLVLVCLYFWALHFVWIRFFFRFHFLRLMVHKEIPSNNHLGFIKPVTNNGMIIISTYQPVDMMILSHYMRRVSYVSGGWPWDFFHPSLQYVGLPMSHLHGMTKLLLRPRDSRWVQVEMLPVVAQPVVFGSWSHACQLSTCELSWISSINSMKCQYFKQKNRWMISVFQRKHENFWHIFHMGVSKNRGTPKWMVYDGKPH